MSNLTRRCTTWPRHYVGTQCSNAHREQVCLKYAVLVKMMTTLIASRAGATDCPSGAHGAHSHSSPRHQRLAAPTCEAQSVQIQVWHNMAVANCAGVQSMQRALLIRTSASLVSHMQLPVTLITRSQCSLIDSARRARVLHRSMYTDSSTMMSRTHAVPWHVAFRVATHSEASQRCCQHGCQTSRYTLPRR
jgi:hypothetical protein